MTPIERFIVNLSAAFSKRTTPETAQLYYQKLSKWNLTDDQWARALSVLVADCSDFPKLNQIYPVLAAFNPRRAVETKNAIFQTFELGGLRVARKIDNPAYPPMLPSGATDEHIVIPDDLVAPGTYEACSHSDIREAFRSGWVSSGADPGKVDAVFSAIDRELKLPAPDRGGGFVSVAEVMNLEAGDYENDEVPF